MTEENNYIQNLNNFQSKSALLRPNISYSYINTTDIQQKNIHTSNNVPNLANLYPSYISNNKNKNINLIKSKSTSNNNIIKSQNNYMNYSTKEKEKINKSNSKNKYKEQLEQNIINNISLESQVKTLKKENIQLQNELKNEKLQRKQDKKNIDLLKRTINNLISDNNKNIIHTSPSPNVNRKTYADLLVYIETLTDENNKLKEEINTFINNKKEMNNIKSKIIYKEKELNDYITKNEELNDKCEVLEKQNSRLNENLKNYKNFEEIKIMNESLEKKLNLKNEEINELKNKMKEKEKEINELKFMKYDDKLFFFEKELNEYKLKDEQNQITINKLNSELNDFKNKLKMTSELLEEGQNTIKENRTNIQDNIIKYNDLKTNYDSLSNLKDKIIIENNELKLKNSQINSELIQFKNNYIKYKEELKNVSMQLIVVKNEKDKNEIYFLNQISLLQKEKNLIENQLNKIREKTNNNNLTSNNNDIDPDSNDNLISKKKYDLALQEIKTYNIDNKKLYDLSRKLKNDLNYVVQEKDFYYKIINKIIKGNYINEKYSEFMGIMKKCIENFLDIQHLNQLKYDLNSKLKNYEIIIKNMNKKPYGANTGKSYEINKNFYDVDDFSEIAKIQNQIVVITDKLNRLEDNKNKITHEMEKY